MLLIGSKALKYWYPDLNREPKDTDYIVDEVPQTKEPKTEYLLNPIILDLYKNADKDIISSEHLTTLKASHLMWSINWEKHMFDLQFLLKKGNKINEELFWKLYDYWNEYHGKNKRSDLKMTKDEFFDNAVNYDTLEHDQTHIILNPVPIYTKILKDGCEVELDKNKFYNLTYEEKLEFVREECYVMAWERYKHLGFRHAYGRMIKKFLINHIPKFAIIFLLENWIELHRAPYDFIKKIDEGLREKTKAL